MKTILVISRDHESGATVRTALGDEFTLEENFNLNDEVYRQGGRCIWMGKKDCPKKLPVYQWVRAKELTGRW